MAAGGRPASVAETDPYTQEESKDALNLVVRAVEHCERDYHDEFVRKVEKRYLAYRGLVDASTRSTDPTEGWRSEVTPPYVLQTCEGMLATMLEPSPRFNVQPRPRPDEPLDEVLERVKSVDAISDALRYALDRDHFAEKQRTFMQQDMIAGISVLKDYWMVEKRNVTKLAEHSLVIADAFGQPYDSVTVHAEHASEEPQLVRDDACCEVRDVRDFFWPAQAASVEKAEYLIDRTWESYASLKRKSSDGYYNYENVDKLKNESGSSTSGMTSDITAREMRLRGVDRTKNLIEVLEYWTPERVITIANRTIVLKDRPNPFWNGRLPFIICASMPDAFQIPGLSVVEALAQLQEMLWTLQNQRLDVVRMLANLVTLIRSDVDDPEAFVWEPGAQWLVEDPGQVSTLPIDPAAANITLQAEGLLKGDLQNIMGGLPMNSGADSQTVDQQTATGVSIITTIAQRIIQARKQHYLWAYARLGKDFLLLYQQFLRDERVVRIVGQQGAQAYRKVTPMQVQGDYDVMIDVTSDSLMRQERRAESQSLLQIAAQTQPIFIQSGAALNLRAFMEKTLDAYDVLDKERYFMPPKVGAAAAAGPPGPPQLAQQPQGPPPPTQGITNPMAAAGPMAPSNAQTISPQAAMSRMMSQAGGTANGGGGGMPGG